MDKQNQEVLLKVDHLCQYFRLGRKDLKAVDDVSFEVRKGETFGLVGESGCGKTTTGRSIIKLYDITSGNVYFKGQRIGAGTRSYKDAIKKAKADAKARTEALKAEKAAGSKSAAEVDAEIAKIKGELAVTIAKNKELIRDAKLDHKEVDKQYAATLVKKLDEEYAEKLEAAKGDEEKLKALKKEYKIRRRVAKKSKLITQIQMIFQDPIASLDPRMTVRDIIAEGMIINGITDQEYINQKVYDILETVGLVREHADRYPHEFSGGQRQRIGIARSVVMEPEMIIADEPVSALDVSIQAQVINLLNDLRESKGLTILFIAHDLSVVKYFSDRIGVMYFGKMVELADSDELFKHPLHPYTKSLLSAIPLPDPIYEKQRVRITYNPLAEHDYSTDQPSFREICPGHFVYCNDAEEAKYKQIVSEDAEG
jgi:oligopeptide transport system ATP-binding protein